jgi:uncharacterized membrane protein YsdA (DUF1294 family)
VLAVAGLVAGGVALALAGFGLPGGRALWVGVNFATLGCYGLDKALARSGLERVPEIALHALALCGGSVGALVGVVALRHKSRSRRFRFILLGIVGLQILVLLALGWG